MPWHLGPDSQIAKQGHPFHMQINQPRVYAPNYLLCRPLMCCPPPQSPQDLITAAGPDNLGQSLHLGALEIIQVSQSLDCLPCTSPIPSSENHNKAVPTLSLCSPSFCLLTTLVLPMWPCAVRCASHLQGSVCVHFHHDSHAVSMSLIMHN